MREKIIRHILKTNDAVTRTDLLTFLGGNHRDINAEIDSMKADGLLVDAPNKNPKDAIETALAVTDKGKALVDDSCKSSIAFWIQVAILVVAVISLIALAK